MGTCYHVRGHEGEMIRASRLESHAAAQRFWFHRLCTHFPPGLSLHGLLRMVTLCYRNGYAWLRRFTRIVTHGYAWLRQWLRSDTRGRNQMVTHGYAWLRMGQFADVYGPIGWMLVVPCILPL